ncbi:unnamed protein product, partial [Closterium sp. NIES-53]
MTTGPDSLTNVNEPTVRRGLILTAGDLEVEVSDDQVKRLSEAPRMEFDKKMLNVGVVLYATQLLSVEQLPKLSIVSSTHTHEEMARLTPIPFADKHVNDLLGKQLIIIPQWTTLTVAPLSHSSLFVVSRPNNRLAPRHRGFCTQMMHFNSKKKFLAVNHLRWRLKSS